MKSEFNNCKIVPVILCGGNGKRLWPLSRESMSKSFLKIYNNKTLLQNTALRCKQLSFLEQPIVVANKRNQFITQAQMREAGFDHAHFIFEPGCYNTAPSVGVAVEYARAIYGEKVILIIFPVDHLIGDIEGLERSLKIGITSAIENTIVLFGVKPTHPSQEYGYIKIGDESQNKDAYLVDHFSEKPNVENANEYYADKKYFWNSGIYMISAAKLIAEFEQYQPEMFKLCKQAISEGKSANNSLELSSHRYNNCPKISFDYAITEKSADITMVELQSSWHDLGGWGSLHEIGKKDEHDNVIHGNILLEDCSNTFIRGENDKFILALGMKDCFIVETRDALLISDNKHLSKLQTMLDRMWQENRSEVINAATVFKPWGCYTTLESSVNFQLRKLIVRPHQLISLQEHQYRSEHWIILKGKASVTLGNQFFIVNVNESIFVPMGIKHSIENKEEHNLELIEVQIGSYFGEDDVKQVE
jgi:mannose-1-phosphate guanylyltransferase